MSLPVRRRRPAGFAAAAACAGLTLGLATGCRSVPPEVVVDAPRGLPPIAADAEPDNDSGVRLASFEDRLPVLKPDPVRLPQTRDVGPGVDESGSVSAF